MLETNHTGGTYLSEPIDLGGSGTLEKLTWELSSPL